MVGIRAAQQVPHLHFHIVPRPEVDSSSGGSLGRGTGRASYVMFGRGQRDELDDEDGDELAGLLRMELAREVKRVRDVEGVDLSDPDAVKGKL